MKLITHVITGHGQLKCNYIDGDFEPNYIDLNNNVAIFMLCSNTVAKDNTECNKIRIQIEPELKSLTFPIKDEIFTQYIDNIKKYYSHNANNICIYLDTCPCLNFDFDDIYPYNYFKCCQIGQRKRKPENKSVKDYLSCINDNDFHVILVTACTQNIECIEEISQFKNSMPFRDDKSIKLLKLKINAMNTKGSGPKKRKFIRYKSQNLFLNTICGQYRYVVDSKQTHILYKDVVRKVYII